MPLQSHRARDSAVRMKIPGCNQRDQRALKLACTTTIMVPQKWFHKNLSRKILQIYCRVTINSTINNHRNTTTSSFIVRVALRQLASYIHLTPEHRDLMTARRRTHRHHHLGLADSIRPVTASTFSRIYFPPEVNSYSTWAEHSRGETIFLWK